MSLNLSLQTAKLYGANELGVWLYIPDSTRCRVQAQKESICRNVYQIWTKDSELITTIDYEDSGYRVIESIFNGGHEK